MPKRLLCSLAISLFLIGQVRAQDNYNFENFGNRSILLNGNVTGSVNDLGATFYNPARIALLDDTKFTINAKVYEYSQLKVKDFLGRQGTLDDSNFNGLPSMVAGQFKVKFLEGHKFAYAFISRRRSEANLDFDTGLIDADVLDAIPGDEQFSGRVNLRTKDKDEWIGGSWSYRLTDHFSLGISAFYSAFEATGSSSIRYVALTSDNDVAVYNSEVGFEQSSHGLFFKAGAAWTWEKLDLGVNIDFPYISIIDEGSFRYEEFLGGAGIAPPDAIFTLNELSDLGANRKIPLGVSAGLGYRIGKSTLHFNASGWAGTKAFEAVEIRGVESETSELPTLQLFEELKPVFNYGVGADVYLSPSVGIYASYARDNSPIKRSAGIIDVVNRRGEDINFVADYNHIGLGVDIKTKIANFVIGGVYSRASSEFSSPIDFPDRPEDIEDAPAELVINRIRVVFGFEILFLDKAKKDLGLD